MIMRIKQHNLFILFSLLYFTFTLLTYKDFGITSDEQLEYRAGKTYFNYIISDSGTRNRIASDVSVKDDPATFPYFRLYPAIVSLINIPLFYEWAHLINMVFGYTSFLIIYLLVSHLTKSKLAILAPLLLLVNPYYLGHIPANPKDIPFSSLYLVGLFLIVKWDFVKLRHFTLIGFLFGILIATRFVGILLFLPLILKVMSNLRHGHNYLVMTSYLLVTGITALITMYSMWPYLWQDPLNRIVSLIDNARDFSVWNREILFEGTLISRAHRPWYYLFTYLGLKTPVLILAGILGSQIYFRKLYLFNVVLVANIILYVVVQPVIYNEMRHFIYLVPLFTVLSSVFFITLSQRSSQKVRLLTWAVFLLGILKLVFDSATLHPYQYIYFNELAGPMTGIVSKYETDYWSASYKESTEYLRNLTATSSEVFKVYPCNLAFGVDYYSYKQFTLVNKSAEADYIICDYQNALINHYDLEAKIVYRVTRKGAVISYVAKNIK